MHELSLQQRTCPECGEKAMHRVREDHTTGMGYLIRDLDFYKCSECGEKMFDSAAATRILEEGRFADKRAGKRKALKTTARTVSPK